MCGRTTDGRIRNSFLSPDFFRRGNVLLHVELFVEFFPLLDVARILIERRRCFNLMVNFMELLDVAFCSSFTFSYSLGRNDWKIFIENSSTLFQSLAKQT